MAVMAQQRLRAFSARRFIGKDVSDVNGDRFGEVDDLIIDMQSACAKYAILGAGGFLGMGERHYVVPMQLLSMNTETGALMANVDRARLTNAPTFDRDNPPDFSDEQWSRSLYTYYGLQYPGQGGQQGSWGMREVGPGFAEQQGGYGQQPMRDTGQGYGQGYGERGYTERQGYGQPSGYGNQPSGPYPGSEQGYEPPEYRERGYMRRGMTGEGRREEEQQGYQQPIGSERGTPGQGGQG